MKKKLLPYFVCIVLFSLFSCRGITFDPATFGFTVVTDTQILNAPVMKASDPELVKNADINIAEALKAKGITDLSRIANFYMDTLIVSFNKDICEKLSSYEIKVTFPTTPTAETVTVTKATHDCSILTKDPTGLLSLPIVIDGTSTDEQYKRLLATDWAPALKNGGKISISVKLKAAQDIDRAVVYSSSLRAHGKLGL